MAWRFTGKRPRSAAAMPRKRHGKSRKEPRTALLKVRLTPEEKAELEKLAGRSTLSRFVRRLMREEAARTRVAASAHSDDAER